MARVLLALVLAPVPPEPKVITSDMMLGRWTYMYNGAVGWMELYKDGEYRAQLNHTLYKGTWYIRRPNELVLWEQIITNPTDPTRWIFEMKLKCRGLLIEGNCNNAPMSLKRMEE